MSSERMAVWLRLAASPCFACMAFIVAHTEQGAVCGLASGGLPVEGMNAMYLLMGLFHLSPWLDLLFSRMGTLSK